MNIADSIEAAILIGLSTIDTMKGWDTPTIQNNVTG